MDIYSQDPSTQSLVDGRVSITQLLLTACYESLQFLQRLFCPCVPGNMTSDRWTMTVPWHPMRVPGNTFTFYIRTFLAIQDRDILKHLETIGRWNTSRLPMRETDHDIITSQHSCSVLLVTHVNSTGIPVEPHVNPFGSHGAPASLRPPHDASLWAPMIIILTQSLESAMHGVVGLILLP